MKKVYFSGILLVFCASTLLAQGNHSFFLELGANGIGFSANYDARFSKSEKGLGYRLGVGVVPGIDLVIIQSSSFLTIPFGINYLAGKAPHYLEAGLGGTYVNGVSVSLFDNKSDKASALGLVPSLAYRYAVKGKGMQFRIVVSPFVGSGGAAFYGGLSFGLKF